MKRAVYESPATEVVAVKMGRTIPSFRKATRATYGVANEGVSGDQLDNDGYRAWN